MESRRGLEAIDIAAGGRDGGIEVQPLVSRSGDDQNATLERVVDDPLKDVDEGHIISVGPVEIPAEAHVDHVRTVVRRVQNAFETR